MYPAILRTPSIKRSPSPFRNPSVMIRLEFLDVEVARAMVLDVLVDNGGLRLVAFFPQFVFPTEEVHSFFQTHELLSHGGELVPPESGGSARRRKLLVTLLEQFLVVGGNPLPIVAVTVSKFLLVGRQFATLELGRFAFCSVFALVFALLCGIDLPFGFFRARHFLEGMVGHIRLVSVC